MLNRCGADDERAIGNGVGERIELLGMRKHVSGRPDGGAGLTNRQLIRMDGAHMERTEITHGASGSTKIERVTRSDEHDAQPVEW